MLGDWDPALEYVTVLVVDTCILWIGGIAQTEDKVIDFVVFALNYSDLFFASSMNSFSNPGAKDLCFFFFLQPSSCLGADFHASQHPWPLFDDHQMYSTDMSGDSGWQKDELLTGDQSRWADLVCKDSVWRWCFFLSCCSWVTGFFSSSSKQQLSSACL